MEQVSQADKEALEEAARHMRAGMIFEDALAKGVQRARMGFEDYIRLASLVREEAKKDGSELERTARRLARSEKQ
ncbi:MAG: hypothetical protein A4E32_00688 [Methanomassiliicoccales archaeon PtaU1.Bin124]|nr:MAG: hypothetical protein A4E32_00688 [Methanomassiliicoccales archaeon PtaU1.Bin124]